MENIINFNIYNIHGQQNNKNSIQEDDSNHSSNNINSNWQNLQRPAANQLEIPSRIGILASIMEEENASKNINISNS